MNPFIQDVLIFGAFALSMLARDLVFTIETKADAHNSAVLAATCEVLGDGLYSLTTIFTIAIVAAGLSHGGEVAQIGGNMAGGFVGVIVGNRVSSVLERRIEAFQRRPSLASVTRAAHAISRAVHEATIRRTTLQTAAPAKTPMASYRGASTVSPSYDRRPQ